MSGTTRAAFILGVSSTLLLAGCVFPGKAKQNATATPPPPKPASSTPAPAPAPQGPLSIPQTVAELPSPQPISPEALETAKLPPETVETLPTRAPSRRPQVVGPPREPAPPVAVQTPPATPPPAEEAVRPPIQEILPPAEQKRLKDSAVAKKVEVKKVLDQTNVAKLNATQRDLVSRIRTLVQQSDEAEGRNEMRQADSLATQAQVLLRELQSGR